MTVESLVALIDELEAKGYPVPAPVDRTPEVAHSLSLLGQGYWPAGVFIEIDGYEASVVDFGPTYGFEWRCGPRWWLCKGRAGGAAQAWQAVAAAVDVIRRAGVSLATFNPA